MILALILSTILFALAAICNAVMDTLEHHFGDSIFSNEKRFNEDWWCPSISWLNKYKDNDPKKPIKKILFGLMDRPFTDAWHTFKTLMILFITLAMASSFVAGIYYPYWHISTIRLVIIYGVYLVSCLILWTNPFNLFYKRILLKKH